MEARYLQYIQHERVTAVDEFNTELTRYICDNNQGFGFRELAWKKMMDEIKQRILDRTNKVDIVIQQLTEYFVNTKKIYSRPEWVLLMGKFHKGMYTKQKQIVPIDKFIDNVHKHVVENEHKLEETGWTEVVRDLKFSTNKIQYVINDSVGKCLLSERASAIGNFIDEMIHYICNVKKRYKEARWKKIIQEIRQKIYDERDLNRERIEPIHYRCNCIGYDAVGKCCTTRATLGAYCKAHSPKAERY